MNSRMITRVASAPLIIALAFTASLTIRTTLANAADAGAPPAPASAVKAPSAMMQRVEQRIAQLHAQLKITAAQEAQWHPFADVMHENAQKMDQSAAQRADKFGSLNAVDNLKSYADLAVEHGRNVQRLAETFESLYNAMSLDQKKLADEVFRARAAQWQQRRQGRAHVYHSAKLDYEAEMLNHQELQNLGVSH